MSYKLDKREPNFCGQGKKRSSDLSPHVLSCGGEGLYKIGAGKFPGADR